MVVKTSGSSKVPAAIATARNASTHLGAMARCLLGGFATYAPFYVVFTQPEGLQSHGSIQYLMSSQIDDCLAVLRLRSRGFRRISD